MRRQRNAQNSSAPRERISVFKVIIEELPKWWLSEDVADLRTGLRLTVDMVAIPIKSARLLSDGLSTGDVILDISKGDYPEAVIGTASIVAGAGAGHCLKTLIKKDPIIRAAGTGAQRSTSEILEKDCFSCNSE